MRNSLENTKGYNISVELGFKMAYMAFNAVNDQALNVNMPPVLLIDPAGGAKDILLPAEADSEGLMFFIVNTADASENLVVKEDSDTTTIGTVAQNTSGLFHCDGTTWRRLVL